MKIISFKNKFSSFFQCSERTIASTETNDTSEESSNIQLLAAGKIKGVALSRGHHAPLPQEHILLIFHVGAEGF